MMKNKICIGMALLATLSFEPAQAGVFRLFKKKKQPTTTVAKPLSEYEKLFRGKQVKTAEGFLKLHKVDDKVLVEIPVEELNKDMMLVSVVGKISDHTDCHPGVAPMVPLHVKFNRVNKHINLERNKSISMCADGCDAISAAVEKSNIGAVMGSYEIKAYTPDSSAVVIDMTKLFTGSERLLSPIHARGESKLMMKGINFRHVPEGSFLTDVKAFKNNVCITSTITYNSKVNIYNRYTTAEVDRMFVRLPENEMEKRFADYRLPLQVIGRVTYDSSYKGTNELYYALRWNLEPVDKEAFYAGRGSEVKKPIIFYIDPVLTDVVRKGVVEGISEWNKAFEAMGYRNVVQFRSYPENDPNFDPENFDYNVIRYVPSLANDVSVRTYADPRSGEILRIAIGICHNYVNEIPYNVFINTAHADPSVRSRYISDERLSEDIKYHFMWLAGTEFFGMTYNLTSSAAYSVDSLRSATFTQKYGTTPSMLDLAKYNTVAPIDGATKGVRLTPKGIGEYDKYMVKWLYYPYKNKATEKKELARMVDEKMGNPEYRYEYAKNCPDCGANDVGNDDLKAYKYQMENLKFMMQNFDQWITDEDDPQYEFRGMMFKMLNRQYKKLITQVAMNIYGITTHQKKFGDPMPTYEYLTRERQLEAIDLLFEQVGRPTWMIRDDIVANMPLDRTIEEEHKDYMMLLYNTIAQGLLAYEDAPDNQVNHAEFINMLNTKLWEKTRQGKELTRVDVYFQNFMARAMMKSSHIIDTKVGRKSNSITAVSLAGDDIVDLSTTSHIEGEELLLKATADFTENFGVEHHSAGSYGELKKWPTFNVQSSRYVYLQQMKNIRKWSASQLHRGTKMNRQHYRYLVDMIDRLLD